MPHRHHDETNKDHWYRALGNDAYGKQAEELRYTIDIFYMKQIELEDTAKERLNPNEQPA